jgi:hypothetical protein
VVRGGGDATGNGRSISNWHDSIGRFGRLYYSQHSDHRLVDDADAAASGRLL